MKLQKQVAIKKVVFSGLVQGVFFRDFVKTNADTLGVKGYVKNLSDGSAEAVFEGEKNEIEKLIEISKKGPAAARVDRAVVTEIPSQNHHDFKIKY